MGLWEEKTGWMCFINIQGIMSNAVGGVLVDAIPGVRVVQEPWIVGGGDLHADLMTGVP